MALIEAVLLIGFSIPLWAARVDRFPPENEALVVRVRRAVRLEHPLPGTRRHIRQDRHQAARRAGEPAGHRSLRSRRERRRHHAQSAPPAGEQADHRLAQEQGRHPQLRCAGVASEAGRHPRLYDPGLVHRRRHDRRDADRTGKPEFQYEIACAQLCGLGHYRMRGFVTVQTAGDFDKWMAQKVKEQLESAGDPLNRQEPSSNPGPAASVESLASPPAFVYAWSSLPESNIRTDIGVSPRLPPREHVCPRALPRRIQT